MNRSPDLRRSSRNSGAPRYSPAPARHRRTPAKFDVSDGWYLFVAQSGFFRRRHAQGRNYRSAGAHARRYSCRGHCAKSDRPACDRCRKPRNRCPERANADAMAAAIDLHRRLRSKSAAAPAVAVARLQMVAPNGNQFVVRAGRLAALSRSVGTLAVLPKVLSRHAVPQFARI